MERSLRLKRFSDRVTGLWSRDGEKSRVAILAIFVAILSPVILIAAFSYIKARHDLTDFTLSRRQTIAYLAAATLKEKFDHLTDIGISLATRVRFRQLVSEGKWDEAVAILRSVPKDFPDIDRVFLSDPSGTLMADVPELPDVRGKNFAFRDWYQGVSAKWKPYLSEVYKRAAEPRYNVVAVAVPIKAENQKIIGILALQVRLNALLEWTKNIEVGPSGFVYLVDRKGQIAAHPKFPPESGIVDFSSVPVVQKVLRGERGIDILFNPIEKEERLSAYESVPGYGWGVIAQQPTRAAFAARDSDLRRTAIVYGLFCLFAASLAYLISRAMIERKRAEEETRKLNAQLEAANKELEAFSYSVSHDLRAPLRAVDGFSRILLEKHAPQLPSDAQRYLNRVRDNAKQMGQLIDDLLAFSRLSRQPLKKQQVAPAEIVRQVITDLQQEQAGRQVEISLGDLPACDADPGLLKQVFANLLANALKFTRQRDRAFIEIGCKALNGAPAYFVKDNGVGFDMQYAGKLFGVFQRLHRAEEFEGTGVGLAIVQRIIRRHGGDVWAAAELDRGSTFFFTLGGDSHDG